ncbi:hypothetical protein ASG80_12465 [Agromyces sp. Soil535]|nr:hypothetical protein ASG80_12465 [Agromyces sp. Soil535]
MSVGALLSAYAGILRELVQRGVIRTSSAPAGDLAETLAAKTYDGALAPNSEKSWDIRAFDGRLIQVKSRVLASMSRTKPVQFSVFRSWDFDAAIFVVFDAETYEVLAAIELPMQSVREKAGDVAWVGGSRLTGSLAVLRALPGAVDRTENVAAALTAL